MYAFGELKKVTGISKRVADAWEKTGIIDATERGGRGRGRHRRFSLVQVVAVAVARAIRKHGAGLEVARAAVKTITRLDESELRAAVMTGRDKLLLIGGTAADELQTADEAIRLREVGEHLVTLVDVGGILRIVDRRIREVAQAQ